MADERPAPLDPDTAPMEQSIWNGIDHMTLERHSQALHKKQYVAGPRRYTNPSPKPSDGSYPLPQDIERSLVDDLAFVAALEPRVEFVSAVTVEQHKSNNALVFRLAANEGVSDVVFSFFNQMFELLRKNASNGKSSLHYTILNLLIPGKK